MKNSLLMIFFILSPIFHVCTLQAAELFSHCAYDITTNKITGSNIDALSPVASISKLMTSHWALSTYGSFHQFQDQIFFQEVSNDVFDVHIQGSLNPFFSNDSLNWLVVQLNQRQISQIRNLTFDENFIYMHDVDQLAAYDAIDFQTRYNQTAEALRTSLNHLEKTYTRTKVKFNQRTGKTLPQKITLFVKKIKRGQSKMSSAAQFTLYSAPVVELLSQMNKTSNNHVADFFFEGLGGVKSFNIFTKENLNLNENEIRFVNGSGGPFFDKTRQKKFYNHANCRTVIKVILDIQRRLNSENLNLWDLMTAVDPEASKNDKDLNPVNDYYSSSITAYSLVGKTGTINPMIAFAGLVSTRDNRFLVAEFVRTKGSSEWNAARSQILDDLEIFITSNGGPKELALNNKIFLSFSDEVN